MATPILKTKLYIPPVRPGMVSRPRLVDRLNAGLHRKLTLISAPAGFGKTTLLNEWATRSQRSVAWVSLDEHDNDLARFLAYFVAALQKVAANLGEGVLSAFQAPQPPPLESLLTTLINEMAAIPDPFALVLDDYHLITAQPIHSALTFLLEHRPPQMHMVIASRTDPPFPLALWRGRQQLTEIRITDLRFTPGEAAAFLNRITGLNLSADDVTALEERTEGWITGLQLAALALQGTASVQGQDDVPGFIKAFTGSHRYVLDYLTEEVLRRQPESVQSFLLETAILDRLTGPLCDALTGREDGTAMLAALEQANLFLVPLDDERRWYRYHRLFADLLRARLHEAHSDRVPELHRRAGAWYEQAGTIDEAVTHAIAADDLAHVGELIATHGMSLLLRGELTTLLRWISALPEGMVMRSAYICVLHAWALLLTGQVQAVESRLQQAERLLEKTSESELPGHVAAMRAYMAAQQGDVERTVELGHLALDRLGKQSEGIRGVVLFVLGAANMLRGDTAGAGQAMAEASVVGQRGGNIHIAVPALNALAGIQALQGHLHQAHTTAQEAIRLATGPSGRPLSIAGGPISALAELAYEWNDLESALDYARQSVQLSQRWGNAETLSNSYLTLAAALQARGDLAGAHDALQEAGRISRELVSTPPFLAQLHAGWVRLWLARGDLAAAARWAKGVAFDRLVPVHHAEALALARVRLALEQSDAAMQVLNHALEIARSQGLTGVTIEALALQALAYHAQGATDRALAALAEALSLAEPEGYVRVFADEGATMAALLRAAASPDTAATHSVNAEYVRKLLAAFDAPKHGGIEAIPSSLHTQPLIEPLSEREIEVLALVAEGLSNRDVARKLYIAESTVKSHLNTVYRKLDVKNRTQAVTRARTLDLI